MNDEDDTGRAALMNWLHRYQGMPESAGRDGPLDPSRTIGGISELLQARLADLDFDSEPAQFLRLLHELAPTELRGDGE